MYSYVLISILLLLLILILSLFLLLALIIRTEVCWKARKAAAIAKTEATTRYYTAPENYNEYT